MRPNSAKTKSSGSLKGSMNNRFAADCEIHTSDVARDNSEPKCSGGPREGQYKAEYARIAERFCRLGATNADLALAFNVSLGTIAGWQESVEEFDSACKLGMEIALSHVERSLYQRARGYDYLTEVAFHYEGRAIIAKHLKHVPASVSAAIFFLCNSCPEEWSRNPVSKQDCAASEDVSESTQSGDGGIKQLFDEIAAMQASGGQTSGSKK